MTTKIFQKLLDEEGRLLNATELDRILEDVDDLEQFVKEAFGMIYWLAERSSSDSHDTNHYIRRARESYAHGLAISPGFGSDTPSDYLTYKTVTVNTVNVGDDIFFFGSYWSVAKAVPNYITNTVALTLFPKDPGAFLSTTIEMERQHSLYCRKADEPTKEESKVLAKDLKSGMLINLTGDEDGVVLVNVSPWSCSGPRGIAGWVTCRVQRVTMLLNGGYTTTSEGSIELRSPGDVAYELV